MYRDRNSQAEDYLVRAVLLDMLADLMFSKATHPRVLDVGCGTGLFLELFPWMPPPYYRGLDISGEMLGRLRAKFPRHAASVERWDMDDGAWCAGGAADLVVSLYGAPSHSRKPQLFLDRLLCALAPGGRALLMYYTERGRLESAIAPYTHSVVMTARDVRQDPVVREGLLHVRRIWGLTYETDRGLRWLTDRLVWRRWESRIVGRLFPDLGRYLVVELEK